RAPSLLPADGLWPSSRGGGSGAAGAAGSGGAVEEPGPADGSGMKRTVLRRVRIVRAAEALYRVLLRAYPRAFRERFAEEMALVFRDATRMALEGGGLRRLVTLWFRFLS